MVFPGWSLIIIVVRPSFPFSPLLAAFSFPPLIVESFPRPALPFWQISLPFTLLLVVTLFSFNALDFPEEDESEEDELVDEVNILSPEEELTEDVDNESEFVFWEEFFLVVAVVPSSSLPVPFEVGAVDGTFAGPPADSPRWWSQLFVGLISPPSPPPDTTELFFDTSAPSFDDSAPEVDPFADFLDELTETDLVLLPCDVLELLLVFPFTAAVPEGRGSG